MNKQSISKFLKNTGRVVKKHSPEILTGIGIAGMLTTTVLAVKATPKALELIEAKKVEERKDELTAMETVKATWKCYIPAAITALSSTTCLICACSVGKKRNAALAAAYKLSETAFTEYKSKVVETIVEKKEQAIRDKVNKERIEQNVAENKSIIITGKGETLCFDAHSGQTFKSDIDRIRRAENILNKRLLTDMYMSLNEFYDEIGLPWTEMGNRLGWNIDGGFVEISFSSMLIDDDPYLVIEYSKAPEYDFDKLVK